MSKESGETQTRNRTVTTFRRIEDVFYVAVALALAAVGAALFVYSIYDFISHLSEAAFVSRVLELLDSMLLVFIVAELLHTVRAVIDEGVLITEPFLIVGIVAVIRRLIIVSAEATNFLGAREFGDLMLELGLLVGAALGLGATIFLLRHTEHSEPQPAHEPR